MKKHLQLASWLLLLVASFQLQAMDIQVKNPHVRAVPPGSQVTAAFMELHNHGSEKRALVDASSPVSAAVELHTHTEVDGVMQMRRVSQIELPAGGVARLEPGGLHLMLIDLHSGLNTDTQVEITLTLDDGSLIELNLPVKRVHGHQGGHQQDSHQHH
ncbi:hypothetical protein SAMN05660443_0542 [Marinospirillum celere]|uniref:Copper(I)-binding protein n=1 Tax=Marinospirillum celere TaxID=1122252 RepID=A0A1I1EE02_9GAMM|nr:copper chaperone PCu(A)C [Marinospirillum celere]SFB85287.1 hypothetical protein SAMN05660443_0542 [Marinospirillum celere]